MHKLYITTSMGGNDNSLAGVKIESHTSDLVVPNVLMHLPGYEQQPLTCGCCMCPATGATNMRICLNIRGHGKSIYSYPVVQVHLGNKLAFGKRVICNEVAITHGMCRLIIRVDGAPAFSIAKLHPEYSKSHHL